MKRRRTESQIMERRQAILDISRSLFAHHGPEDTSMDDLAEAVGCTRRTLYAYFKSADEIRLLLLAEDLAKRWKIQQARIAEVTSGLSKLVVWAEALYDFSRRNPHATRLQAYWDYHGVDRRRLSRETFRTSQTVNTELADGLRAIFYRGIEDGSLRSDLDVDTCISQFLYSLRSIISRALSPGYSFTRRAADYYVRTYVELFCRGIGNLGGSS